MGEVMMTQVSRFLLTQKHIYKHYTNSWLKAIGDNDEYYDFCLPKESSTRIEKFTI